MKALAIGVATALALGAGTYFVMGSDGEEAVSQSDKKSGRKGRKGSAKAARGSDESRDGGDLEERVASLEREVKQLRMQVKMQGGRVSAPGAGGADVEMLGTPAANAVIHEVVQDAFQDAKQQEREERKQRFNERMSERREEALAALGAAGLAVAQQQEIGQLWSGEQDQIGPLIDKARNGELDRREVRTQIDAIREQTDQAAYALLDESQQAAYNENRPGPGGRGPRGGGGPRGGQANPAQTPPGR